MEVVTEVVCFVPYTPESTLCKEIQRVDDIFAALHDRPRVRFVERPGPTIEDELSRSDPWASDYYCGNPNCTPCCSRAMIKEEKRMRKAAGEGDNKEEGSKDGSGGRGGGGKAKS